MADCTIQQAELIRQAIALNPNSAEAHNYLGIALVSEGQLTEGIAAFRRAIALRPDNVQAYSNLGNALKDAGQLDEAIAAHRQAITLAPNLADAHYNLGIALKAIGSFDDAIAAYRQAISLDPNWPQAHNNLANALKETGQFDEAIAAYHQAISLSPDFADAHNNLGIALAAVGQLDEAIRAHRRAIALRPDFVAADSNILFSLQFSPAYTARAIAEEHRRWNQRHAEPLKPSMNTHVNNRSPDRRLRVGYVSPDFREHCQSLFTAPLLSSHDHDQFEVFCYSSVRREDAVTARLRGCADAWRAAAHLSDAQLAAAVREDGIDILVDLTMHMGDGRLLMFARRPAPVQVTWLAYPGSTGMGAIDYRISDPWLDPPGIDESIYSERTIRLPDTFWCYNPRSDLAVSDLPASLRGHITFGCLNNYRKLNASVLKLWSAVLRRVRGARLKILSPAGSHRERAIAELSSHGVEPSRIQWLDRRSRANYLQLYHQLDICLDTFPYNGHTTSLDAMWMGVPVISRIGDTVVGRAGWSQLSNLNLTELAAQTDEQFVTIAAALAGDLPRLAELRRTLRPRMTASPLMDAPRFAHNMEAAYRRMWRNWLEQSA